MIMRVRVALAAVLGLSLLLTASVSGGDVPDSSRQAELTARYMELMQPGLEHKLLAGLAGSWKQEIKYWITPGSPASTMTGMCDAEMILGGRFLQLNIVAGNEDYGTEALQILGYDRRNDVYTSVGFDTWGTYFVTAEGTLDESTGTISMYGETEDKPIGHIEKYIINVRILGDDSFIWEIIMKDAEETFGTPEFKVMEIKHVRIG
jgi:hypothetical protein